MDPRNLAVTTPGLDDTPYIRFAIDQLTRDEEIRGTRHYAAPAVGPTRQPTEPLLSPYEEEMDYPVETGVYDEGLGYMEQHKAATFGRDPPAPIAVPARHPQHTARRDDPSDSLDTFVAFRAPYDSPAFPALRFLSGFLRPVWIGLFILLTVLMLIGLTICAISSAMHGGLWSYVGFGDNRYFAFEYLPVMFGMAIVIWLFEIQGAVTRIAPFVGLASQNTHARSNALFIKLSATQYLIPDLQYFSSGQPVIGACFLIFWLFLFSIPLLGASFNVQWFGPLGSGEWRWVAVQGVIWPCIALYVITIAALLILAINLWRSTTGLRWDPRSLADTIAMLSRSNITADFAGTETFFNAAEFRQRLWRIQNVKLGYWHSTRRPRDIFYGIGEEGGPTRVYSVEGGRIKEKARTTVPDLEHESVLVSRWSHHSDNDIRSKAIRRRYLPWFLQQSALAAWTIIAVVLYIAFLTSGLVRNELLHGFSPDLPAGSNNAGFSAANFLYSFIPGFIGLLLFLLWQPIDLAHRRLEPWKQLSNSNGATAENSLLLDYTSSFQPVVTVKALGNRHWAVAYNSFMSTINATLPVIASGIFWAQYYPGTRMVRIAASPPALYALCFFLALYALSFAALFPGRRDRALPHDCNNLVQIVSWLYQSRLLGDRAFSQCDSKAEMVTRLVAPSGFLTSSTDDLSARNDIKAAVNEKAPAGAGRGMERVIITVSGPGEVRYGFGVYIGRDGLEHLGVDRIARDDGNEMVLFDDGRNGRRS